MKKVKPIEVIIDLEFTGLDNSFISDNEIIQMKAMNMVSGKVICHNYTSKKNISAYGQLAHKVKKYKGAKFSKELFHFNMELLGISMQTAVVFYGFGVQQDCLMLGKYGIRIPIIDVREMLQLSKFEQRLATEGSGLESSYLIVTGDYPDLQNHDGLEELSKIADIFKIAKKLKKKKHLTIMPHGHCSGMPLKQYISNYRRAADGYRFNNSDILSDSMNKIIDEVENQYQEIFEEND